jgi:hypothetical protein
VVIASALRYAPDGVSLLTDLEAGIDEAVVCIACECGASMVRRADEDERATAG